jgi:hypothetical protein
MQELNAAVPPARPAGWGRIAVLAVLATALAGCDMVELMRDGIKHTEAVTAELTKTVGVKPQVGFNWNNGRLTNVSVIFPKMIEDKPLRELAKLTQAAVAREFKQRADDVQLGFSLGPTEAAMAQAAPSKTN